jgi:hypothetical protein
MPEVGSRMIENQDLARRYSPGENVAPLLRALAGGLAGALLALALDWVVPSAAAPGLAWPSLIASAVAETPRPSMGLAIGLAAASLAALAFAYGQFRRFIPGPAWLAGIAWGMGLWLVAAPMLLPGATFWQEFAASGSTTVPLLPALGLVFETTAGIALYGAAVGFLNPAAEP